MDLVMGISFFTLSAYTTLKLNQYFCYSNSILLSVQLHYLKLSKFWIPLSLWCLSLQDFKLAHLSRFKKIYDSLSNLFLFYWSILSIKKQRNYFADKGPSSQGYGFASGHVWMWELDCEESRVLKNWCFWTVVLEKSLESALDCREIQPIYPQGNQSWIFTGRTDSEAETPILWHLMWRTDTLEKTRMVGKIEGRRRRGQQKTRWLDDITNSMDMSLSKL